MSKLPKRERELLRQLAWGTKHFGSFAPRGKVTVRKLEAKGLAKYKGLGVVVDGDGWALQPERWRDCWAITAKGKRWLAKERA